MCVSISNGYANPPDPPRLFSFDSDVFTTRTSRSNNKHRSIDWPIADPVPIQKEIQLLMSGILLRRGEFGPSYGSRAIELELECANVNISFDQALCIRKQLMMSKVMNGASWKLKDTKTMKLIVKEFEQKQRSLLDISHTYDLPPVSIFRAIVSARVLTAYPQFNSLDRTNPAGRIVQSIINEANTNQLKMFLTEWEIHELHIAKEHDIIVYYNDNSTAAEDWEKAIYDYLNLQQINYITENTLKYYGYAEHGTPDCLIVDNDVRIHGKRVRWIEFKSFYASGLKQNEYFTKKTVGKQVEKYGKAFGKDGAVILKHGFSTEICRRYPSTLFLDGGVLHSKNDFNLS
jgi:hypothetical protein